MRERDYVRERENEDEEEEKEGKVRAVEHLGGRADPFYTFENCSFTPRRVGCAQSRLVALSLSLFASVLTHRALERSSALDTRRCDIM